MNREQADIWVVAGAPGSGKTTVSELLLDGLTPHPALLDKDTMYNPFDEAILSAAGRPLGEREGPWYDEHIKRHVYKGLTATAKEVRSYGCPVLLSAPFTGQIHNAEKWRAWVEQLGGETVHLVWIRTDTETLKERLLGRGSERDTEKLANFEKFIEYMQIESPPPIEHIVVDNRKSATETLGEQVRKILSLHS